MPGANGYGGLIEEQSQAAPTLPAAVPLPPGEDPQAAATLPAVTTHAAERPRLAIPWRPLLFGAVVAIAIPALATVLAYLVYPTPTVGM